MSSPPALTPHRIEPGDADYAGLLAWPFPPTPFFVPQVLDLLRHDLPHRCAFGTCFVWLYRDATGEAVGFGSLEVGQEYPQFSGGLAHTYIPVLAVHPLHGGKGHGRRIVEHLTSMALLIRRSKADLFDHLLLDVYRANAPAIGLYEKCGFETLNATNPTLDPNQNNEPFLVMARHLA